MKKFAGLLLATVLVASTVFTGCGKKNVAEETTTGGTTDTTQESKESDSSAAKSDQKAACILGIGGLGDQSFNDLIHEGMKKAEDEFGVEFDYAEPTQVADFEVIMRDMCDSGEYGVIICVGFDQMDALATVAPDYPDQKFAYIDGVVAEPNVVSYTSKEQEGSFLVGALAGLMKMDAEAYGLLTNNQIGFIGAMETDLIVRFAAGYKAGAEYVNKDTKVDIQYVSGDNPFGDTTTAKEIASSQNNKGADIIYHAAGGSGLGVFSAATEGDFYAIGCNSNQNAIDGGHIVASMLKRVDTAAYNIVKSMLDNSLKIGEEVVLGLSDEGIGYTLEGSNVKVSEDIVKTLEDIKAKIISGEIEVPAALE